jgi:hypothetical protein
MIQDLSSILDCVPKANIKETSRRKEDTAWCRWKRSRNHKILFGPSEPFWSSVQSIDSWDQSNMISLISSMWFVWPVQSDLCDQSFWFFNLFRDISFNHKPEWQSKQFNLFRVLSSVLLFLCLNSSCVIDWSDFNGNSLHCFVSQQWRSLCTNPIGVWKRKAKCSIGINWKWSNLIESRDLSEGSRGRRKSISRESKSFCSSSEVRWDEKGNWQKWSEFEIGIEGHNGRFERAMDFSIKNVIFSDGGRRGRNLNKRRRLFVGNAKARTTDWRSKQRERIKDLKLSRFS